MNLFLKIKSWQLFCLMIIVPMLIMIVADPFSIIVRSIYGIISVGSFFGWLYSLGAALHKKLPSGVSMNLTYFKASFLILIFFFFAGAIVEISFGGPKYDYFFILIPLILFLWIFMFNIFYFVSKSLKMVELKRQVTYYEYIDTFFLLWFYPIGIWSIQPRVNELFKND